MNNKKQNILVGIISIIGVAIIVLMLFLTGKDRILGNDDNTNQITFKVYYEDNSLVIDEVLKFNEKETLLSLMERTHTLTTRKDGSVYAVLSIDSYTSDFMSSYFSLYVDGAYSPVGANDLILTGGLLIEWKWIKI